MGVACDKKKRSGKLSKNKEPRTTAVGRKNLIALYSELSKCTDSKFNKKVLKQLRYPKRLRVPLSINKIIKIFSGDPEKHSKTIFCTTSTLVQDKRDLLMREDILRNLKICAYKISGSLKNEMEKLGTQVINWGELVRKDPLGENCQLLLGNLRARRRYKYMGLPCGFKESTTRERAPKKIKRDYRR